MTPAARVLAIIELFEEVLTNTKIPCDKIIQVYMRNRRYIGSKDRRFIISTLYYILKRAPRYEFIASYKKETLNLNIFKEDVKLTQKLQNLEEISQSYQKISVQEYARLLVICALCEMQDYSTLEKIEELFSNEQYGGKFAPQPLTVKEKALISQLLDQKIEFTKAQKLALPEALLGYFEASMDEESLSLFSKSSLEEAPLDLRVNTLKASLEEIQKALLLQNMEVSLTKFSPFGLRLNKRYLLEGNPLFKEGKIAVQDEGSQLISLLCDVHPSMKVLDYCAGAGGKTLALASLMKNKGTLIATDLHAWRLEKAKTRFKEAGVFNVNIYQVENLEFKEKYQAHFDRVLVDAPCSGTGTFRRNPDLKMRTTPQGVEELIQTQREILKNASTFVKEGGYLIYATCSVLAQENQKQIEWFLAAYPNFIPLEKYGPKSTYEKPIKQEGLSGLEAAVLKKDKKYHDNKDVSLHLSKTKQNVKLINAQETKQHLLNDLYQELKLHSLSSLGLTLSSHTTQTDGFYICILQRKS